MTVIEHKGKKYKVVDDKPQNYDLVLTDNYGVWVFKDENGSGSAPLPYWANNKACKKLVEIKDG